MTNTKTESVTYPYRYDVVGSLLRPQALKQARARFAKGLIDADELAAIQHDETKRVVNEELNLGLKAVTDGEFNRSWWHLDFLWGLNGVGHYDYHQSYKFHGSKTRTDNADLVGKIAYNPDHQFFATFSYLQTLVPAGIAVKQTIPSPTMLFRDNRSDNWHQFYETWDAYLDDLAQAYHQTIQHFYDLGCRYLQLDDTTWAFLISQLNATADQPDQTRQVREVGSRRRTGHQPGSSWVAGRPDRDHPRLPGELQVHVPVLRELRRYRRLPGTTALRRPILGIR